MSYGFRGYLDCGKIYNYPSARSTYEGITPIRSVKWDESWRPLKRTERSYWLIKQGDDYVARMYHTDVVRWKPDGVIEIDCDGWATSSTASFISRISPYSVSKRNNKLWVAAEGGHYALDTKLQFKGYECLNPVQQYKQVLNKERAKEVRTSFKPFLAYVESLYSLMDVGWDARNWPDYEPCVFDIADESTYYSLFRLVSSNYSNWSIISNIKLFRTHLWSFAYSAYKCYDEVPVPLGKIV